MIGDVLWINVNGNSGCEKSLFVFVGRLEFFCNFASNWLGYANYVFFFVCVFAIVLYSENCQFSNRNRDNRHKNAYAIAWVVLICYVGMAVPLSDKPAHVFLYFLIF